MVAQAALTEDLFTSVGILNEAFMFCKGTIHFLLFQTLLLFDRMKRFKCSYLIKCSVGIHFKHMFSCQLSYNLNSAQTKYEQRTGSSSVSAVVVCCGSWRVVAGVFRF